MRKIDFSFALSFFSLSLHNALSASQYATSVGRVLSMQNDDFHFISFAVKPKLKPLHTRTVRQQIAAATAIWYMQVVHTETEDRWQGKRVGGRESGKKEVEETLNRHMETLQYP